MKNETLQTQIESIRQISNDEIQERDEDFYWGTGDLCDRASHQARIELAKEAILIIDELQKKLNEMTICRDKALEQPFKLAQDIVELRNEIGNMTKRLEIKKYIAVIDNNFGVIFPDFDGCVSVGKDLNDAINMAQEALEFHVSFIREYGEELPEPTALEQVKKEYHENVFKYQPIFIK
jgi:predicted RNase H-like HicB family nuclease